MNVRNLSLGKHKFMLSIIYRMNTDLKSYLYKLAEREAEDSKEQGQEYQNSPLWSRRQCRRMKPFLRITDRVFHVHGFTLQEYSIGIAW